MYGVELTLNNRILAMCQQSQVQRGMFMTVLCNLFPSYIS